MHDLFRFDQPELVEKTGACIWEPSNHASSNKLFRGVDFAQGVFSRGFLHALHLYSFCLLAMHTQEAHVLTRTGEKCQICVKLVLKLISSPISHVFHADG